MSLVVPRTSPSAVAIEATGSVRVPGLALLPAGATKTASVTLPSIPSQLLSSKFASGLSGAPGNTAGSSGLQSVATAPSPSQSGGARLRAPAPVVITTTVSAVVTPASGTTVLNCIRPSPPTRRCPVEEDAANSRDQSLGCFPVRPVVAVTCQTHVVSTGT